MSSTAQFDTAPDSRSPRNSAAATETYGGQDLPILIRLPDLSVPLGAAQPVFDDELSVAATEELSHAEPTAGDGAGGPPSTSPGSLTATAATEVVTRFEPVAIGTATAVAGREQQRRLPRQRQRARDARLHARKVTVPGWLRGLGQFALAAVLAGVLLAILIALKDGSSPRERTSQPTDGNRLRAISAAGIGEPTLEPLARVDESRGLGTEQRSRGGHERALDGLFPVGPPTVGADLRRDATDVSSDEQTQRASAMSVARDVESRAVPAHSYPTTGVPVVEFPQARPAGRAWSEILPMGTLPSAQRSALPNDNQQR